MPMTKRKDSTPRLAICIQTDDADLLTPRMIYQVWPDEDAASSNYIRVIDNEGEDYLYSADYFVFQNLPRKVELALLHASDWALLIRDSSLEVPYTNSPSTLTSLLCACSVTVHTFHVFS